MGIRTLFREKIYQPIIRLLKQGLAPKDLALSLASGCVIGVFPFLGAATWICVVVAALLRFNHVAIQIANYAVYPLQFVFLLPFIRLGESILQLDHISISPLEIFALASEDFFQFMKIYGLSVGAGCLAWVLVAIPVTFCLWFIFYKLIQKLPPHLLS